MRHSSTQRLSPSRGGRPAIYAILILGLLVPGYWAIVFTDGAIKALTLHYRVDSYVQVPGRVESTDVGVMQSRRSKPRFHAELVYGYEVGGVHHIGTSRIIPPSESHRDAEATAAKWSSQPIAVWYDPAAPHRSALSNAPRPLSDMTLIFFMPAVAWIACIGPLIFVLYVERSRRRARQPASIPA